MNRFIISFFILFGSVVTVSAQDSDTIFYDGQAYTNSVASTYKNLIYKRTFSNKDYNCLYVPFEINIAAVSPDFKFYAINTFKEYDSDGDSELDSMTLEVNRIHEGILYANNPYLVRYTGHLSDQELEDGKEVSMQLADVTLQPDAKYTNTFSSLSYEFTLCGVYNEAEMPGQDSENYSLVNTTEGVVLCLSADTTCQRWFITMGDRDPQVRRIKSKKNRYIHIEAINDTDPVAISHINATADADNCIYSLSGQRLSAAKKGINIIGGKKVLK